VLCPVREDGRDVSGEGARDGDLMVDLDGKRSMFFFCLARNTHGWLKIGGPKDRVYASVANAVVGV
jgi:hypothetical protein